MRVLGTVFEIQLTIFDEHLINLENGSLLETSILSQINGKQARHISGAL